MHEFLFLFKSCYWFQNKFAGGLLLLQSLKHRVITQVLTYLSSWHYVVLLSWSFPKQVGVKLRPKKKKAKYKVTRGVSCIDLGPGECQGWLQKKTTTKFRTTWVEMWFVLREFVLYYYKNKKVGQRARVKEQG